MGDDVPSFDLDRNLPEDDDDLPRPTGRRTSRLEERWLTRSGFGLLTEAYDQLPVPAVALFFRQQDEAEAVSPTAIVTK